MSHTHSVEPSRETSHHPGLEGLADSLPPRLIALFNSASAPSAWLVLILLSLSSPHPVTKPGYTPPAVSSLTTTIILTGFWIIFPSLV